MKSKKVYTVNVEPEIMKRFDEIAKEVGLSRSSYFRVIASAMGKADTTPISKLMKQTYKEFIDIRQGITRK